MVAPEVRVNASIERLQGIETVTENVVVDVCKPKPVVRTAVMVIE